MSVHRLIPILWFTLAIALALGGVSLVLSLLGHHPDVTIGAILGGAFGSGFGLTETLLRLVPILLCALAAAIPAESGQFNIGAEGQLHLGAVGAMAGAMLGSGHPPAIALSLMVAGAIIAGAAWGAIPAGLRAGLGINEALTSLFLNYVAIHFLQYLVHGPWKDPASLGWPMSPTLPTSLWLKPLGSSRLHAGVFVVVGLAIALIWLIQLTRLGFELRAVGRSPQTSRTVHIPVRRYLFGSMVCGAALAGMAGFYEIAAVQHRLRPEISPGFGYSGFLVAWMCRGRLWLLLPFSLLVAGLVSSTENLQITTGLPAATAEIAQGLLLLLTLLGTPVVSRLERRRAIRRALEAASE
jgi:ABC-type uncharacterized transport system permease subunit